MIRIWPWTKFAELERDYRQLKEAYDAKAAGVPLRPIVGAHTIINQQVRIEQLEAQLKFARHEAVRAFVHGEDKLCLVCGAKEPCELKDDPSSPCTFEPTPIELFRKVRELTGEKQQLEAQLVAMTQERDRLRYQKWSGITELEARVKELEEESRQWEKGSLVALLRENERLKAQVVELEGEP